MNPNRKGPAAMGAAGRANRVGQVAKRSYHADPISASFGFNQLVALTGGRLGVHDVACPHCGPMKSTPASRTRPVLRVWHSEPGFVTFNCPRCPVSGWASDGDARPPAPERLQEMRREAAIRDATETAERLRKAQWLASVSRPSAGTLGEVYFRSRGYDGPLQATLRFLPPRGEHGPAVLSIFGLPDETEPGILQIAPAAIRSVHLTRLTDAGTKIDKKIVGRSSVGFPIVVAPMNDGLGLVLTEGIEDALSIHAAWGVGAWAAGTAGRMPALAETVPAYADCITIAAHADPAGLKGAAELGSALKARGLYAETITLSPLAREAA